MSRARTWRSHTAGRKINTIDCRRLQPISSAAAIAEEFARYGVTPVRASAVE
jgi:hypothetical protein